MTPVTFAPCVPPCGVIPLHRPWWRRAWEAWHDRAAPAAAPEASNPAGWAERDLLSLRGLSAGTLRDIGAPEWVREGREERARVMLDLMRL
jgi:hypothetical protein